MGEGGEGGEELLQQMFRTPPPELLHMLITPGSIPHAGVFRQDAEGRARSGSIGEFIGKRGERRTWGRGGASARWHSRGWGGGERGRVGDGVVQGVVGALLSDGFI